MTVVKAIVTVVFLIISIAMIVIVLMQEGKSQGLGSIAGSSSSDTFWGKNKSRSVEGKLEKYTKIGAIVFMVLALVLNML